MAPLSSGALLVGALLWRARAALFLLNVARARIERRLCYATSLEVREASTLSKTSIQ
jgi:hypothetical protein